MKHDSGNGWNYEPMPVLSAVEQQLREAERYATLNSKGQYARDIRRCIDEAVREIDVARAMERIP